MRGNTREKGPGSGLEAVGGLVDLIPAQARPVDIVYRSLGAEGSESAESGSQREVAAAAARTAVAGEIERLRPGEPYVLQQGCAADYPGLDPELPEENQLVIGVVYRFGE